MSFDSGTEAEERVSVAINGGARLAITGDFSSATTTGCCPVPASSGHPVSGSDRRGGVTEMASGVGGSGTLGRAADWFR